MEQPVFGIRFAPGGRQPYITEKEASRQKGGKRSNPAT